MALNDINSEDRLAQQTFADHLRGAVGWETIYAWTEETFGLHGSLNPANERDVVLVRDLLLPRLMSGEFAV